MTGDPSDTVYVALIGDIRGSRELEDRADVQDRFRELVGRLNEELLSGELAPEVATDAGRPLASRLTVTAGDEFQGLLADGHATVRAAVAATDRFEPAGLRFGLGRGTLATDLNEEQAIGMDGPCFHRAREALKAARTDEAWIRVAGWPGGLDRHANRLFDLVQAVREDWTDRQAEFARALQAAGSQQRVAERFGVSKSTVSESLSAGHVHEVRAAETSGGELLDDHLRGSGWST